MTRYTYTVYRRTPKSAQSENLGCFQYQGNALKAARDAGAVGDYVRSIDNFIFDMDGHEFDNDYAVWVHVEKEN